MTNSATSALLDLYRAADAEVLADALAEHLAHAAMDVFDEVLVTCEGPGAQRWLAHRLAGRLGIAAAIASPTLARWADATITRASGLDPRTDPWRPPHLSWAVLQELERPRAWTGTVLDRIDTASGLFGTAEHVAEVLLDYARRDPDLLARWAEGDDAGVPDELAWQPELWRLLRRAIPTPDPVTRLAVAEQALRSGGSLPELPREIHLWAPGLPAARHLRLLSALASTRRVRVWLPGFTDAPDHPLAIALGREQAATVAALEAIGATSVALSPRTAVRRTLLDRLRADLAEGVSGAPEVLEPDDASISLHACHGPERQAEVLRDVLCGLLDDDPTLQPRDVLVVVADPAMFPVLEAAFARVDLEDADGHPGRALPVRFADPELRDHNALLTCLADALRLGRGRAGVTELVAFMATDPVARRFGLDADGLERAHRLVTAAGVRWGMNTTHRRRFGLEGIAANTWLTGLNRLLVGIAMSEDGSYAVRSALPLDDVGSSDIEVVGAVAELMVRLIRLAREAEGLHPPHQWVRICREAVESLTAPGPEDAWQLDHAWQVLADIGEAAPPDAPAVPLDDLLAMLTDALGGRPPRSAFRSGAITVCTPWPARHVPHRVVCVVGLDDSSLPRPERLDGDNVLDLRGGPDAHEARHRERQVFLDLVRSARQHLVLTWTGADPRTGEYRPPAVVVPELLDAIDRIATLPEGRPARDALVIRHPLQSHDPSCFGATDQGPLRPGSLFGFDPAAAAAARVLVDTAAPVGRPARPDGPLATRLHVPPWQWEDDVVPLADVVDVVAHPARAFLRRRAGFSHRSPDGVEDSIPLELDGLGIWQVGSRVLEATLRGDRLEDALRAEFLRGTLPPGSVGEQAMERVHEAVDRLLRESAAARAEAPLTRHLSIPLAGGETVTADVTLRGRSVVSVGYSRVSPRQRIGAWFDLLVLAAGGLDRPQALLFGRNDQRCLTAPGRATALALLEQWVGVATAGLTTPLPLPLRTGALLASSVRLGTAAADLAAHRGLLDAWERDRDGNWRLLWGDDLAALTAAPRPAAIPAFGSEASWTADLARALWSPIDQSEERR